MLCWAIMSKPSHAWNISYKMRGKFRKNIILHFLITARRFTDLIKDLLLRETQFFYSQLIRDLSIAK